MKKYLIFLFLILFSNIIFCLSPEQVAKGFVYLHEIDPSIKVSLKYCGNENFLGSKVEGYKKSLAILTSQAANALKEVQNEIKQDGYCLVIYDAYRPQKAVNNFMSWSLEFSDQCKKQQYYPRVNKEDVFDLGYIAKRSSHSRGSTVDLTLIEDDKELHEIIEYDRILLDGFVIKFLDDGTVDMGSHFDLFDLASHYDNNLIEDKYKKRREYLKTVMEKHGFKNYAEEWWHFTLKNEPYPDNNDNSYFDFDIE